MPNKRYTKRNWWKHIGDYMKAHTSLIVIIAAALLLEMTSGVMYYSAQGIIQRTVDRLVQRELKVIQLCIRNKLAKVEVVLDNMAWVVTDDLAEPDSLLMATRQLVEHYPDILGSSISCIPYYYPQKGHWYEPYSVRRADGTIGTIQLGSADHDYTKSEFFTEPIAKGIGHWCEPYYDRDGAKSIVTSYCVPVRDGNGKIVAVVDADISLKWLEEVINEGKEYKNTQRFLVTGNYNLLVGEDCSIYRSALEYLKADDDKTGYVELDDEFGKKKHVYYTNIGGMTNWMLINVLDDSEVFGKLSKIRVSLLLPLMIGLFFVGFIVFRSSRNLERLRKVNAEKERISGELRVASEIQQSMLPHYHHQQDDVEIFGSLVPAREVGGDLYDYFIRNEKLFFCIGDVSGKGVPSAMLMAVTHVLFRSASAYESNPARIMLTINETLCQGNESNMFVTMFVGVLDLLTGRLRYCDAGHDAPIVLSSQLSPIPSRPHLPVGVFDDVKYDVQEIQLLPESTIFLYTDGLTEAKNEERKQFGLERVKTVLGTCFDKQPKEILEKVTEAVRRFVKDAEQSDDLTMLAIRYMPKQFESILTETLVIKNDVHEVTRFSSFFKSLMEKLGIEKSLARQLRLAVEEAVVNAIDYAYPVGTEGKIEIHTMYDGQTLHFKIIDSGVAFDPTSKEKADTTLSAEDRQIGGLGILLVREFMDSINYERTDGMNVLTLIKNLK